jgi:hypothetical protein
MVHDRQDFPGMDTPAGLKLKAWLNGGALGRAKATARALAEAGVMTQVDMQTRILFGDAVGCIKASPKGSWGYLYVCAYLNEEVTR